MKNNEKRVPTQVRTRELDRAVAKNNMEKRGMKHINKKNADGSFFSKH